MVRKVRFKPVFRPTGAGADSSRAVYSFTASYTSRNHSVGGGMDIMAPNIEVTVPDNWGANTLAIVQQKDSGGDDSVTNGIYLSPLGEPITMNIIIKAE